LKNTMRKGGTFRLNTPPQGGGGGEKKRKKRLMILTIQKRRGKRVHCGRKVYIRRRKGKRGKEKKERIPLDSRKT